jgi:hypothetical protein
MFFGHDNGIVSASGCDAMTGQSVNIARDGKSVLMNLRDHCSPAQNLI